MIDHYSIICDKESGDKWIKHYIKEHAIGKLTTQQYWDKIVDVKKDFDIERRMQ